MAPLLPPGTLPVLGGAALLGLVHGAEPGHGWPIAAAYALDRDDEWRHGLAASVLLGLGHLASSLAVVAVFLLAKSALHLDRLDEPLRVLDVTIGSPLGVVAGGMLVALGVREYRRGHGDRHSLADGDEHGHDGGGGTDHGDTEHAHDEGHGHHHGHDHSHRHGHLSADDLDRTGLAGIVWTAFVLGFVHEEEFEIIGLCAGSSICLDLMLVYALAVLAALVGLTLLVVAGYDRHRDRMERLAPHLGTLSAAVLVTMGLGFVLGLF